jgi:hypothetical protein
MPVSPPRLTPTEAPHPNGRTRSDAVDLVARGQRRKIDEAGRFGESGAAQKIGKIFETACDRNRLTSRVLHGTAFCRRCSHALYF